MSVMPSTVAGSGSWRAPACDLARQHDQSPLVGPGGRFPRQLALGAEQSWE